MLLKDLLRTCGNEIRFIKIYWVDGDEHLFDINKPDYVYTSVNMIPDARLSLPVLKWGIHNDEIYILI